MIALSTTNPLELSWAAGMFVCVVVEFLLLLIAYSDRRFIQEQGIDNGAPVLIQNDITLCWLRMTGSMLLLAVGVLAIFTPRPRVEQVQTLAVVGGVLFLTFSIERIVYDLIAFNNRRRMLSFHGSPQKGLFLFGKRKF